MVDRITVIESIKIELSKMGFENNEKLSMDEIRSKDGVSLFKVNCADKSYVIKYFTDNADAREILNYSILNRLGIPTIKVITHTEKSILLEDISCSNVYRLGFPEDLSDIDVARLIARWYKTLHTEGEKYLKMAGLSLYRETDILTEENIAMIKEQSNTKGNPVWPFLLDHFKTIRYAISSQKETFSYNDFYWTNLVVKQDRSAALMFDYHLLGIGYRYGDIRNVCSSLSDSCKAAFLEEYGSFDEEEKVVDDAISPLISFVFAFQRASFPSWANHCLQQIRDGELYNAIHKVVQLYGVKG